MARVRNGCRRERSGIKCSGKTGHFGSETDTLLSKVKMKVINMGVIVGTCISVQKVV